MWWAMDVHRFHHSLLGTNKGRTPDEFWLSDVHTALYSAYPEMRGFSNSERDEALFLATFVLALAITEVIHPVYVAVPKPQVTWVVDQIERIGRYIFRCRKGDKEGSLVLRQAFRQIRVTFKFDPQEPERWVMFGFKNTDVIPDWAKNHLLEYGELRAPLAGART